ncbi:MAG: caspase family protein, partial [Muribaculaceae bacterium]|nr:caspase family protein [Muribaculaceae bacterium]
NLGYMYDKGFGVPQDYSEAVKWYRKAAEQGYPIPQCSLGDMYYYGHGVAKDLSEAKKWWEKSAAQGFGPAKDNLKKLQATEPTEGTPTLFWIECPAKTGNSQFALKVGVNSSSAIKGYDVMLNGSATRGIKTVTNDGYDLMIDQPLTLAEGNNEIRVEATNASGRTVETRSVMYEKAVKPSPSPEQVQKRIALVVGNGAYSGAPLRNTLNDASAIASELRGLGFEVIFVSDANKKKFDSAVNDFGLRARDYDVAMFYYAGHGIQYKGENFLVPVDATLSTQSDVEYECVNVNRILSKLEDSDVKMKIIALDACRNNPFERSWHRGAGSSRGLSAINVPIGTFISYATSPGTVAADGEGDHSPYTSALLQTLKERNLPIESVFKKVASIVVSTTGRAQLPWYTSSLFEGEFVFNPTQK